MGASAVINEYQYGDPANSSILPYTTEIKGEILWEKESPVISDPQPLHNIAIVNNHLVLDYGTVFNTRNREDGSSSWISSRTRNFRFHVTTDGIFTLNTSGFLDVISFDKKIVSHLSLPFVNENAVLLYSSINKQEITYCYQRMPEPTSGPGDRASGPEIRLSRLDIDTRELKAELIQKGMLRDILFNQQGNFFYIIMENNLHVISSPSFDSKMNSLSFEDIKCGSIDKEGNLLLIAEESDHYFLMCLDRASKVIWRYQLETIPQIPQPPTGLENNKVLFVNGNRLLCLNKEKLEWETDLPCEWQKIKFSVLSDKSILAAAGQFLFHFSSEGKELRKIILKDSATCRPIVDEKGRIYVGGSKLITCFK